MDIASVIIFQSGYGPATRSGFKVMIKVLPRRTFIAKALCRPSGDFKSFSFFSQDSVSISQWRNDEGYLSTVSLYVTNT